MLYTVCTVEWFVLTIIKGRLLLLLLLNNRRGPLRRGMESESPGIGFWLGVSHLKETVTPGPTCSIWIFV